MSKSFLLILALPMGLVAQAGVDPGKVSLQSLTENCSEVEIRNHFVPTFFESEKSTIGPFELDPVIKKLDEELKDYLSLSQVEILATSAKTPYFPKEKKWVKGEKVFSMSDLNKAKSKKELEPIMAKIDSNNLELGRARLKFGVEALNKWKASNFKLKETKISATGVELSGPEFNPDDRANIPKLEGYTKDYDLMRLVVVKEIGPLLEKDKIDIQAFEEQKRKAKGMINLYQLKYHPFQGFKIKIVGLVKINCKDQKLKMVNPTNQQ